MTAALSVGEFVAKSLAVLDQVLDMTLWVLYGLPFFVWFAFNDWRYARR